MMDVSPPGQAKPRPATPHSFRKSRRVSFIKKFLLSEQISDDAAPGAHRVFRIGHRLEQSLATGPILLFAPALARVRIAYDAREELKRALHFRRVGRVVTTQDALMQMNNRLANLCIRLG